MRLKDYARTLIAVAETMFRWAGDIAALDAQRREKIALFSEEIAATLARAAAALARLEASPAEPAALLAATRELGRISGYVETIVAALERHLDGRKRAGVKRRLEALRPFDLEAAIRDHGAFHHARRLTAAEGYFRAFADSIRV